MPADKLNRNLRELHRRLERTDSIDPEARESLKKLLGDIERLLDSDGLTESSSLIDSLETQLLQLSDAHPALAAGIRQVVDGLSSLGI